MAVNIDTVYQRVLSIANKEQRGYVTPQEFNLYANQAQMDIFEQYFYDLNLFMKQPGNDSTHADMVDIIKEKIDIFETYRQPLIDLSGAGVGTFPAHYRMGEVYYKNATLAGTAYPNHSGYVEIEKLNQNDAHHILNSALTQPTLERPCYVQLTELTFQTYPTITVEVDIVCNYIANPALVAWGYVVNSTNGAALYNANTTTHFELHDSEESELVIKILELAGIEIKDPQVYQIAAQEEAQNIQEEKQ